MTGANPPVAARSPLVGLRANTLAALVMLLVQYGLGIAANLYAALPPADHGKGIFSAFGAAIAHGPVVITLHALLGTLLLGAAFGVLIRSLRAGRAPVTALASVALTAIVVAWLSGATFIGTAGNGTSLAMAVAAGIAILCFALILFVTPFASRDAQGIPQPNGG